MPAKQKMEAVVEERKEDTKTYIGKRTVRREDSRMITGHGRYTEDITPQGTLYAHFLRSDYAHARIKATDISKAESMPGVVAVYTGKDFMGKLNPIPTAWNIPNSDLKVPTYLSVATDRVRYVGDPVAVVVAETPFQAEDAAEMIEVEYDPLDPVIDQEKAVKDDAPQLYDEVPGNIAFRWKLDAGNVDSVFSGADVIVKERFVNQRLQPASMETRGLVASYDAGTGETTVWMTSQNPHVHRFLLSLILGVPENHLRIIAPDVGGGFGSKISCYGPEAVVCYLSRVLKKPVKWMETREENFLSTTHGRDHIQYVEMAAKKDGTILGLRAKVYANMGAWLSTAAPGVPTILFGLILPGQYDMKAVGCDVYGVLTNTVAVDAYRGAGRPEASFIVERMVDVLAAKLHMDPAELRLKNFISADSFPHPVPTGLVYDSGNYEVALKTAMDKVDYYKLRKEQEKVRKEGKYMGIGISSYIEVSGLGPSKVVRSTGFGLGLWESATVRIHPTGKVSVFTGGNPHGQGEETTFAQLAADELQVPMEDVEVIHGDTSMIPFGMGTYGSRTTVVAGGAIAIASRKLVSKAKKIAAHLLGVQESEIIYTNGRFHEKGHPEKSKTMAQVAMAAYGAGADEIPDGMEPGLENTSFFDPENFVYPFGTHICVAEVDPETFQVRIKRYVAVDDCGTQINPMIVEGQIHGGVVQGLAQALYEESVYDQSGNLLTSNLSDYAVPTAVEIPRIESSFLYTPSPHNPIGVKGVGEAGSIAAPSAIVNAVVDALSPLGITHINMPLKPENIWKAVMKSGKYPASSRLRNSTGEYSMGERISK